MVALPCGIILFNGISSVAENTNIVKGVERIAVFTAEKLQGSDLSLKEALYYRKLVDGRVQCQLCPTMCIIPEGGRGVCRARANVEGTLRAITYGKPVTVHVDPIEKKPLFHFYPTSKAFSIATVGCNLGCIFCQNWTISQAYPEEENHYNMSPEDVVKLALENDCKTIAYTYTEPTIFYEYMLETCQIAHQNGLKNLFITCGYINPEPLRELCQYMDAANVDLKGFSEEFYGEYCFARLEPVLKTLTILKEEGVWIEVTNLLIPEANDDPEMIRALAQWVMDNLGPEVPLHFSRFHPNYKLTDRPPTPTETLEMACQIARDTGIKYVFTGNVPGNPNENTYCPACGKVVIGRRGYFITEYNIEEGCCKFCGEKINGIWE
ncbi:AmmeMemoRadiSam system radical SAM enzyme [bacterium]|nr:AmmeMemoRadiSam system radical SAM enzyme [bacterium]